MNNIRTMAETRELEAQAEQRARAGESLSAIASAIGVPTSTLSERARKGGWRRKDLKREQEVEIARLAPEPTGAVVKTRSAPPVDEPMETWTAAELAYAAGQAGEITEVPPETTAMAAAHMFLSRGMIDKADKAVRLASRFILYQEQIERRRVR